MDDSRRKFLTTAAASGALAAVPAMPAEAKHLAPGQITARFKKLPGDVAFKILVPDVKGKKDFVAQQNSNRRLFAASAIKTFVLCEALRQAEADPRDLIEVLEDKEIALDSTIWSFGSPTFIPEAINGVVTERTAMEAMITRSDNTATDMMFKVAGADNVRKFIASAGLTRTSVPDSTRAFTGYVFGAVDYKNLTWDQVKQLVQGPLVHPLLNDVQTLASSADDFVSYYSRALQGKFFRHPETLNEFRRVLTLCDFVYLVPFPLGVSAYTKSGNADMPGFHARSIAGGLFTGDQWIYFAFMINWYAASGDDRETLERFFSAVNESLSLVVDSLSKD